jgi:hypothetical protein
MAKAGKPKPKPKPKPAADPFSFEFGYNVPGVRRPRKRKPLGGGS